MNSNTSSIFMQQSLDFQFLSVCHYITIFGIYFYNNDLITLDEKSQSVPVLNTLFEYLNKSKNESEAKFQLLKKVLKGSDLYGGGENETLDMKYVDETYQYIISEALFSHYGNINGYLAKIINMANNVNYSVLKEKVFQHLSENYTSREYCSNDIPLGNNGSNSIPLGNYGSNNNSSGNYSSINILSGNYSSINIPSGNYTSKSISSGNYSFRLNGLTIQKVFDNHIWPIFPQPEQDMSIMEVNYIYAMVGLKIIRSVSAISPNLTFHEYILISREIDFIYFNSTAYEMALNLFSTPALFFYAFNQKEKFKESNTLNNEFWISAYRNLFKYIRYKMSTIVKDDINSNLHYQLEKRMNSLKSRSYIAAEVIRLFCDYKTIAQVSLVHVELYKTLPLAIFRTTLPKECNIEEDDYFPDLNEVYDQYFIDIEILYNTIERNAIEKILIDSKLAEKMNSNVTVELGIVPNYDMFMANIPPTLRKANNDIYLLFALIEKNKEPNFYAFKQDNNILSLLTCKGNEQQFAKAVANDPTIKMEVAIFFRTLKLSNEDYRVFIKRIADIKTKQFIQSLKKNYYNETIGEKIINLLKSLVPFYNCIESVWANDHINAVFSCTLDALTLIPVGGLAVKYISKLTESLAMQIGKKYLISNIIARTNIIAKLPIVEVMKEFSIMTYRTIASEILTKQFLTDFTVTSLRTLDPGFELSYQIGRFSYRTLCRMFKNLVSNFKKIPEFKNIVLFGKSLLKKNFVFEELVLAKSNDYEIVRYYYPGGFNLFGPKCLIAAGKTMELRSIEGYSFPLPVVREGNYYKEYIPEIGESKGKLKMDNWDTLRRVNSIINELIFQGGDIGKIHNYHVYYNRVNWQKISTKGRVTENVNQPAEGNYAPRSPELPESSANTRQQNLESNQLSNSDLPSTSRNQNSNLPKVTSVEYLETLTGSLAGHNFPTPKLEHNYPQALDALRTMTAKYFSTDGIVGIKVGWNVPELKRKLTPIDYSEYRHKKFRPNNLEMITSPRDSVKSSLKQEIDLSPLIETINENVPESFLNQIKETKLDTNPETFLYHQQQIEELDNIPGTSKQLINNVPNDLLNIIGTSTFIKYRDILMTFKNYGMPLIKRNKMKINLLRTTCNELALLQLNQKFPLKVPSKLWYTQIIRGEYNINFVKTLKGKTFFFNDITMLSAEPPKAMVGRKLKEFPIEIEVRYHLTIDSSYGFVDITQFHEEFKNNYIIFNDVLFTVTEIFYTPRDKILIVHLRNHGIDENLWRELRNKNNILGIENQITESTRMETIGKAANFLCENTLMCRYTTSKDIFSTYILNTNPSSTSLVPTYNKFAHDLMYMQFQYPYDDWRIENHHYIQDVLLNQNLDQITELSTAKRKIQFIYSSVYLQNIEEAFLNYKLLINAEQQLRFEDYYVLYSHLKHRLVENKDGIRRLEAAINRIGLRQCNDDFIYKSIKLYRGEIINSELSPNIVKSFMDNKIVVFDKILMFTRTRDIEELNCLKQTGKSSEFPVLMEITLTNQAGVVDLNRVIKQNNNYNNFIHIFNSKFQFIIEGMRYANIRGRKVLVIEMRDYESPTETRMVRMANKLHDLFSTNTKFYSDLK
ncbi:uncharacterized protein LOC127277502 [Leptopilina boulardi]|uniref:uncharacterized protein LOC127277502 n=1 Tax=Leptopilina boulardi TaxID=63433 RepID=UPI0021F5235B|nr:uncharacterized protein LOC127277502 [Leptopilina boulardi]